MELSKIREKINSIDSKLVELFKERMDCAKEVAKSKAKTNTPVLNSVREEEVLQGVEQKAGEEYGGSARIVFSTLMEVSRAKQYEILNKNTELRTQLENAQKELDKTKNYTVACQGVEGAYSEIAAKNFFPNSRQRFYSKFEDVFKAVSNDEVDFGVLPVENSTAGSVTEVYDLLLKYRFFIVGADEISVNHCLGAKTSDITKLKKVYSHPQGLNQCTSFIEKNGLEASSFSNTAAAAKHVATSNDDTICAICSKEACELMGLKIVDENIQNAKHNSTRFAIISKKLFITPDANKISLCFSLKHSVGTLHAVLSRLAARGLNVTKIESRPILDTPFEYNFYLDFNGCVNTKTTADLLSSLFEELPEFGFLGNYNEVIFKKK